LHLLGPASYHASVEKPQKFVQNSIFYNVWFSTDTVYFLQQNIIVMLFWVKAEVVRFCRYVEAFKPILTPCTVKQSGC
jgi:hypothetical protein